MVAGRVQLPASALPTKEVNMSNARRELKLMKRPYRVFDEPDVMARVERDKLPTLNSLSLCSLGHWSHVGTYEAKRVCREGHVHALMDRTFNNSPALYRRIRNGSAGTTLAREAVARINATSRIGYSLYSANDRHYLRGIAKAATDVAYKLLACETHLGRVRSETIGEEAELITEALEDELGDASDQVRLEFPIRYRNVLNGRADCVVGDTLIEGKTEPTANGHIGFAVRQALVYAMTINAIGIHQINTICLINPLVWGVKFIELNDMIETLIRKPDPEIGRLTVSQWKELMYEALRRMAQVVNETREDS